MTLIELLIGITISLIIFMAVYESCRLGLRLNKKIDNENYVNQNIRQAWRQISRDIRCAFMSGGNANIRFIGRVDKLSFTTYLPGNDGLAQVTYYIDTEKNTEQEGLIRETNYLITYELDLPGSGRKTEITPLAKAVKFRFFNGLNWGNSWGIDNDGTISSESVFLPYAVEMQLTIDTGKNEVFTVLIPVMSK